MIDRYALMLGNEERERNLSDSHPVQSRNMMDLNRRLEACCKANFPPESL